MSRYYSDEFKEQIVLLYKSGKRVGEINSEYDLGKNTVNIWVKQYDNSGKFTVKANLTKDQMRIKQLEKEVEALKTQIFVLKQTPLILGKKSKCR